MLSMHALMTCAWLLLLTEQAELTRKHIRDIRGDAMTELKSIKDSVSEDVVVGSRPSLCGGALAHCSSCPVLTLPSPAVISGLPHQDHPARH